MVRHVMTAKRRAALRKAQLASARLRKKNGKRARTVGYTVAGAATGALVGRHASLRGSRVGAIAAAAAGGYAGYKEAMRQALRGGSWWVDSE